MILLAYFGSIAYIVLVLLTSWQESRNREIHFLVALIILILATPLFGYFIVSSFPLRNPMGCMWCGNKENEVEYCGVCGKNIEGDFIKEHQGLEANEE